MNLSMQIGNDKKISRGDKSKQGVLRGSFVLLITEDKDRLDLPPQSQPGCKMQQPMGSGDGELGPLTTAHQSSVGGDHVKGLVIKPPSKAT